MSTTSFDEVVSAFKAVRPELEKTIKDAKAAISSYRRRKVQANEEEVKRLELKQQRLEDFISIMDAAGDTPGQIPRGEVLTGATYKLQIPTIDEAVYMTINSVQLPSGPRPVEVFVNSKNMQSFQWISALTRLLSSCLQQPGPFPAYVLRELQEVHDPNGAIFFEKRKFPSVVAILGATLEHHCKKQGVI